MPLTAARAVLRPSRQLLRRTAPARAQSTTSEASSTASKAKETASDAASKAKSTASDVTSKASQGLSRVTSSAGSALSSASGAASSAAQGVTSRTSRLISAVSSLAPSVTYYAKVGAELSKLVFHGQKMSPPTPAQFQEYFQALYKSLRNPSSVASQNPSLVNPQNALNQFRNLNGKQLATVGIVGAEVLGFFCVGEMLGRFKIVGYRGGPTHAEGH